MTGKVMEDAEVIDYGADTMQSWDISVKNSKGRTSVKVGHDMRDPEITEVV